MAMESLRIETPRLELTALGEELTDLLVNDITGLEAALDCVYRAEPLRGEFLNIVSGQLEITRHDRANFMWHSFWLLIRKSDRTVIGAADFKDVPDINGRTEIGYGLGRDYLNCGYMTEAVSAMCGWAFSQKYKPVSTITAETETENAASQAVLKRCGFSVISEGETIWWEKSDIKGKLS